MPYDNLCKSLIEQNPRPFVQWLLGEAETDIAILKTELPIEPIRADFVSFRKVGGQILHLEFQIAPDAEMPLRMLDYFVRLYRQYRCTVVQIVLFLKPSGSDLVYVDAFDLNQTHHGYRVVRLWEEEVESLLAEPRLWPLAILANSPEPESILQQVAQGLEALDNRVERVNLATYTYLLGGLRFRKAVLQQLLREEIMRESVTYQDLVQTSEQRGLERGLNQGLERGLIEGLERGRQQGESDLIMRILEGKFGSLSEVLSQQIRELSIFQLERLAENLLVFQSTDDLEHWLNQHSL